MQRVSLPVRSATPSGAVAFSKVTCFVQLSHISHFPFPPPPTKAARSVLQEDNNTGTFPLQSERFFSALKGHGGPARVVLLPHEGHGYRARESVLHTLYEQDQWLERHAGYGRTDPSYVTSSNEADSASSLSE
eukprot:GHRQ01022389.1.p2 GENE.GHRQ01022389.1~~GHRQ01022389.1.p2  ORF type:complete len:133 (+),score=29.47 GHRQ01022389.1:355-753(+)